RAADVAAAAHAARAVWNQLRADCEALVAGRNVWISPLWSEKNRLKNRFSEEWAVTKRAWQQTGAPWDRFAEIYDDFWSGTEPDWDFLEQIVLIDPEIWNAGPEAVAEAIANIENAQDVETPPTSGVDEPSLIAGIGKSENGEEIIFNENRNKFNVEPLTNLPRDIMGESIETLTSTIDLFDFDEPSSNQYRALEEELELLKQAVERYADRPRLLYIQCTRVTRRLAIKFQNGDCPAPSQDANVGDFYVTIMEVATGLRERDPLVREAVAHAGHVHTEPVSEEDQKTLEEVVEQVLPISEGLLASELPEDLGTAIDPDAPLEDVREARLALGGRLLRIFATAYHWSKAGLQEVESVTKSAANISVNAAKVAAALGVISMPVWLEKAVSIVLTWF
ncbi:MAG: hypothetical protein AAGF94_15775, partial [Pseudomonadota bacterium]